MKGWEEANSAGKEAITRNLLAALKATLATLEEAADLIVSDPGHSVGFAAQMSLVKRKAEATIAKAEGSATPK